MDHSSLTSQNIITFNNSCAQSNNNGNLKPAKGQISSKSNCTKSKKQPYKLPLILKFLSCTYSIIVVSMLLFSHRYYLYDLFYYFTDFGYFALTIYISITFALLLFDHCYDVNQANKTPSRLRLELILSVLYHCIVVYHPIISLIFWTMLFDFSLLSDKNSSYTLFNFWLDFSQHFVNFVQVLVEITYSKTQIRNRTLPIVLILGFCYLGWAYFIYIRMNVWTYQFLDYTDFKNYALNIFLILVLIIFVHFMALFIHNLRDRYMVQEQENLNSSSPLLTTTGEPSSSANLSNV